MSIALGLTKLSCPQKMKALGATFDSLIKLGCSQSVMPLIAYLVDGVMKLGHSQAVAMLRATFDGLMKLDCPQIEIEFQ